MSVELRKRSIHDLRVMAQAFGVTDIFEKDAVHLAQEIELKQQKLIPPPVVLPPRPEYDARLMTKRPAQRTTATEVVEMLATHVKRGLKLSFENENWFMYSGIKSDTGSLRMPLRVILTCAENVMR